MNNIRYVHRRLDVTQVLDALSSAGLLAVIEPGGHKAMQPEQSHGRWQVTTQHFRFEVHPGYSKRSRQTPDMLIVQGLTGWSGEVLDHAVFAITVAREGIQHQQKWFTHSKHKSKDFNRWVRRQIQKKTSSSPCCHCPCSHSSVTESTKQA